MDALLKTPAFLRNGVRASSPAAILITLLACPAFGQPDETEEPPLIELELRVVTGTRIPKDPEGVSSNVTVLSGEEIEETGADSLTEVLRSMEGVHIDQPGGRGGVSSVYIRGADPNHTVVIIDGIKVNDPMNSRGGSFDFSTLNTDSIERIEVVRGPLSSVYGSDAIAGAVHIITRRPASEPEARLEISGGSFGYHRALLEARGTKNRFEYSLGGSFLDNGEPVKGSGFTTRAFQARTEVGVTYRTGIHSSIRYAESRMEAFPDDSGGPEYAVIRASDDRNAEELLLGLGLSHLPYSKFSVTLQADYFDRSETVDSPGVAPGIRDPFGVPPNTVDNDFYRTRVSLENRWEATDAFHITLGGIFEAEEGESTGLLMFPGPSIPVDFELRRDLWAAFLEGRYKAGNYLTFEGAGRWDDSEDFDPQFSPRAGFSFLIPASGTRLIADWGKGFKLPAFFSLSHPIVGNPDLGPEKSLSWEWGISQSLLNRRVRVHAIYFSSRIEDGIDLDEGPPPRLVNRDAIKAHGIEVGGTLQASPDITLIPHMTYVKTDIENSAENLRGRPEWRGGVKLSLRPSNTLKFFIDALYVGTVHDSSIPTGDRNLDPYTRVNLSGTWNPRPDWEVYWVLRNLFDVDYEEAVGFPAPGIHGWVGARIRL